MYHLTQNYLRYSLQLFAILLLCLSGTVNADNSTSVLKGRLESALQSQPDNIALLYYLGVINLRDGDPNAAINHWQKYLSRASNEPLNSQYISVREQLTILKMRAAQREARKAVTSGAPTSAGASTIAVLEFKNESSRDFDPFVKGLTAMIITDLGKVPELKVVERARMQALFAEMRLGQIGVIDPATSARVGKLLQAQTIDWGSLSTGTGEEVTISSILSDTSSQSQIGEAVTTGPKERFFELEKQLVFQILSELGINKENLERSVLKALEEVDTTSLDAFMAYGQGLIFMDAGNFAGARQSFEQAASIDPGFDLAETAVKETPVVELSASSFQLDSSVSTDTDSANSSTEGDSVSSTRKTVSTADSGTTDTDTDTDTDTTGTALNSLSATPTGNTAATLDIIDTTTQVTQDTKQVDLGSSGPSQRLGYFVNMLVNGEGTYHGTYYISFLQDLDNWSADSTFTGSSMEGQFSTINSLVVLDVMDPVTQGIPNETVWTELGNSSYLTWGQWNDSDEMIRQSNPPAPFGRYSFEHTGYFVYGDATTQEQMTDLSATDINFTYSGDAYGTHFAAPNDMMTGSFSAQVQILGGFADMSSFGLSIANSDHSADLDGAIGHFFDGGNFEVFGGTWTVDGTGLDVGDISNVAGALYGPGGEAMAGTFFVEKNGGDDSVTGLFEGIR